ncbi:MAG: hypothetical protein KKD44_23120 [Proteobacteria bacterium]|nr:hypothetical protein [Pseudomonadota bacterium]
MKTIINSICAAVLISLFCLSPAYGDTSANETDAKIKKIKSEITKLIKSGREMEQYRTRINDLDKANLCEEKKNEYLTIAIHIGEEVKTLSKHLELRMAVFDVVNCTSCSSEALIACDEAEINLSNVK